MSLHLESSGHEGLDQVLAERAERSLDTKTWSDPIAFSMEEERARSKLEGFLSDNPNTKVIDALSKIRQDLARLHNREHEDVRHATGTDLVEGAHYGTFFYFPWRDTLVRYPSQRDNYDLLTARNRNLIRPEEQERLGETSIAVFGLSVGRAILSSLVRGGIGKSVMIADPDTIDPTNLNRISASYCQVGSMKVDDAAREVSEANPYLRQVHLPDGIQRKDLENMQREDADILVDAVDDLSMKAHIRETARRLGLPVLMATDVGRRVLIDIERHDLGDVKPFLGRVSAREHDALLGEDELDPAFKKKMLVKIVGIQNASARMIESLVLFSGGDLDGVPQLNSTVISASGLATDAVTEILLGRHTASRRYKHDKSKTIGARKNPDGFKHLIKTYAELLKS